MLVLINHGLRTCGVRHEHTIEAFAVGNLDAVNPSKLDIWKINHDGNLIQISEGLP